MKLPIAATLALALVSAVTLVACKNTREGARKDAEKAAEQAQEKAKDLEAEARRGAEKAREATQEAAGDIKEGAAKAAESTAEALDAAGRQAEAAAKTLAVKSALMADARVDASRVDVDSDVASKTVRLRGSVATEAEKAAAGTIAAEKAGGWRVANELSVAPKP